MWVLRLKVEEPNTEASLFEFGFVCFVFLLDLFDIKFDASLDFSVGNRSEVPVELLQFSVDFGRVAVLGEHCSFTDEENFVLWGAHHIEFKIVLLQHTIQHLEEELILLVRLLLLGETHHFLQSVS